MGLTLWFLAALLLAFSGQVMTVVSLFKANKKLELEKKRRAKSEAEANQFFSECLNLRRGQREAGENMTWLRKERNVAQKMAGDALEDLDRTQTLLDDSVADAKNLRAELAIEVLHNKSLNNKIEQLTGELEHAQATIDNLRAVVAERQDCLQTADRQHQDLSKKVQDQRTQIGAMEDRLEVARKENVALQRLVITLRDLGRAIVYTEIGESCFSHLPRKEEQ